MKTQQLAWRIGYVIQEAVTRDEVMPFVTGDLRKSITVDVFQSGGLYEIVVGSNLPYARAVHDGRPALTIYPRKKKALYWKGAAHPVKKVEQPARVGKPYLRQGVELAMPQVLDLVAQSYSERAREELNQQVNQLFG